MSIQSQNRPKRKHSDFALPLASVPKHGDEAQKGYGAARPFYESTTCFYCEGLGQLYDEDEPRYCPRCHGSGKAR